MTFHLDIERERGTAGTWIMLVALDRSSGQKDDQRKGEAVLKDNRDRSGVLATERFDSNLNSCYNLIFLRVGLLSPHWLPNSC